MRYGLSGDERSVIKPMLPNSRAAFLAWMTGALSMAYFGSSGQVRRGEIFRSARNDDLSQRGRELINGVFHAACRFAPLCGNPQRHPALPSRAKSGHRKPQVRVVATAVPSGAPRLQD